MFFTWIPFLLATAVVITNAVPLNLVRVACARNPQLAFCDSHILGLPTGAIQQSAASTSTAVSPTTGVPDYGGNGDFVRWLNEQDDEVTIDEREHHTKLSDKKEYCAKYKANFGNYCNNGIEGKLDGILPQFCAVYIQQCKGDGSEFPRPDPLPNTSQLPKMKKETEEAPMKAAGAEVPTKIVAELPPHAAQETAMLVETEGFKDGVLKYCEKFADKYKHFCQGAQPSGLGKTNEFCSSYRDSCHHTEPSATSKVPAEVAPPETQQATGSVEAQMEAAAAEVPTKVVAELPPHAAQETAMVAETEGFKGGVLQYCEKFADQYKHFCQGAQRSELGKTDEFCSSYRDSCHHTKPSATSKVPAEVAPPETEQATGSVAGAPEPSGAAPKPTASKTSEPSSASKTPESPKKPSGSDIDDVEEFPESAEVGAGSQSSTEEENPGKGSEKDPKVQKYCDEFWENYNYYCAGDQSTGHEKFCRSYRTNCPHKLSSLKSSASFLGGNDKGEDASDSERDGGGSSGSGAGTGVYRFKGTREEYCEKFAVNYEYYCTGDSDNPEITAKFCPSYKKSCRDHPQSPANPFTKNVNTGEDANSPSRKVDANFPDLGNPKKGRRRGGRRRVVKTKYKRPCTADCDRRLFPHCTAECKCDYAYPYVQKFCNPPPLPLFLQTCRLWYSGCPKYERYHYASQFIYSKAEKGKKVELPTNQKPFSVLSPNGEKLPVNVRTPGITTIAKDDPVPPDTVRWDSPVGLNPEDFEPTVHEDLRAAVDSGKDHEKSVSPKVKGKKSTAKGTKDKTPSQKDDPGEEKLAPDERSKDTPIVPSDSVFSNALQQYGSFTDSGGVLHRPRSRSPFTKPGLWEPNPDNPHNRDHANKWYYHPRSVNVDWLSGQIAWGAHWAVPAAAVGGTDGFSTIHFPTIGTFANIPDDYD